MYAAPRIGAGLGTNLVDPSRIMYYGLSFGGIYGTMLMGTDPLFHPDSTASRRTYRCASIRP